MCIAKTGSGYKDHRTAMGSFGKGKLNENGIELLELCEMKEMN